MALTYKQTQLVRGSIPALREQGERITTLFYRNMLTAHPELNNYFNAVNQANGRQPRALTAVILQFAANINHLAELVPKLERMSNKHCSLGIRPEHYDVVGKYLLEAFAMVLGPDVWTSEMKTAWARAYAMLANMLIGREKQMYREFGRWNGWREFTVRERVAESADGEIVSFYLVPVDGKRLPNFMPGQYVSVRTKIPTTGYLQSRQYSLSDAPSEDYYRITVKKEKGLPVSTSESSPSSTSEHHHPGLVSNYLIDTIQQGHSIELSHPAGEFFLDTSNPSSEPLVLISAGVGVTPMASILSSVMETLPQRYVSWVHGSRGQIPFESLVTYAKTTMANFKTYVFRTRLADAEMVGDGGLGADYNVRIDLARLKTADLFLEEAGTLYFICGPERFMVEMNAYLKSCGVPSSRIRLELFSTGDMEFKKPVSLS